MRHKTSAHRDIYEWQQEEILASGDDFFASLLDGIGQAQNSIEMDFYIFDDDALGQKVMDALMAAARRQVKVRLIIDGAGSVFSARKIASVLSASGIAVHIFHPFPLALNVFRWSNEPGNVLHRILHFFRYGNRRNHHKLCIIDEHYLWTGSFNISAQHLSKANGGDNWHDYGVKITDNNLQPILQSFNHLFDKQSLLDKKLYLPKIRSNITILLRKISNNLLVHRISHAQQRIWICSAYFCPSPPVLKAIKKAREHGVEVCIILPAISDVFFMPWLARTYYRKLLEQGVRIYEYRRSILHAKLLLIDDNCLMGSTNLNHRSFHHDLELDIVLSKPDSIRQIEDLLLEDMQTSRAIVTDDIQKHRILLFFARFFRLFRYWL